jgi:hypothetical protein
MPLTLEERKRFREYQRKYFAANRKECNQRTSAWKRANPEKLFEQKRREYGYPLPTRPRPKRCECCGRLSGIKRFHLDHDHATGNFRGWLCAACNLGIGCLGDSRKGLLRALKYLEKSNAD